MSQRVGQIFCQRCLAANSLGQELCGKCGTRLMLVVEPTALRFEEESGDGAPSAEFLLERVSALEGRLLKMAERLEQTLDLMLRQARTSYLDHALIETIIAALDEAGVLDRQRVVGLWRAHCDRDEEETARAGRRNKLKERVLSLYRGAERDEFTRLVQEGFDLLSKGGAAKAVRTLERAAALALDNAPLNSLLGEHFFGTNRRALARDYLERALAAERDPRTALLLGLLLADEGDAERARGLLNEVVGGGLQSYAAHYALGRLHFAEGDARVALAEFQRALRARPGPEANYVVGAVSYLLGRRRAAARYFSKAVELDPAYAEAYYALGVVHLSFDEREQAAEAFDAALAADKKEPRYREARRLARRGRTVPELLPFGPAARSRRRLLTGGDPRLVLVLQQDAMAGTLAR